MRGGREARSPGLATLKEAFDVTYAVHRAKEEGDARRGARSRLHDLNEDDEDEDQGRQTAGSAQQRKQAETTSKRRSRGREALNDGRAGMHDPPRHRDYEGAYKPFELSIDNATLLGRRHRNVRAPGAPSPLAHQAIPGKYNASPYEAPGSPMQIG